MGKDSSIQWCDSSLNLQMGCDGCELWNTQKRACYAGKQTQGRGGVKGWPDAFDKPKLFLERMDEAEKWKVPSEKERAGKPWIPATLPRLIFLNDMGDTFSAKLPLDWMAPMLPRMAATPHQYLLLTKRPSRLVEFTKANPLPANVWPGTTVTSPETLSRVKHLANVQGGGPRFISAEPLWGLLNLPDVEGIQSVSWIIFGGESGDDPKREDMDLGWLEWGIVFARSLGIAPFVKQYGAAAYWRNSDGSRVSAACKDSHGGEWEEWNPMHRIREFPKLEEQAQASLL